MKKLILCSLMTLVTYSFTWAQAGLAEHNRVRTEAGKIKYTIDVWKMESDKDGNHTGYKKEKVTKNEVPQPLVWDAGLAKASKVWANKVNAGQASGHDPNFNGWENIFFDGQTTTTVKGVKAWETEKQVFNKEGGYNNCNMQNPNYNSCGHYKNIIDPTLKKVGCAVSGTIVVCRYANH